MSGKLLSFARRLSEVLQLIYEGMDLGRMTEHFWAPYTPHKHPYPYVGSLDVYWLNTQTHE